VIFAAAKAVHRAARRRLIPAWVLHLGLAGVFLIALLDAAPIPLPIPGSTDILILILGAHGESPWLLAPVAVAGSLIGAYFTWSAGKKGGEKMLDRYLRQRRRRRIEGWVERHGVLSVSLAAMLPPPLPLMPFLLAAGALGVKRRQMFIAMTIGRTIRYGGEAVLAAFYGRRILRLWHHYLAGWSSAILCTFLGLMVAAIVFGIWKYRHDRHLQEVAAAQGDLRAA
jgi:membrane protein YqaA with SNARE-associated domain